MLLFSSGGCVDEVVDIRANYQGYQSDVHSFFIYFVNHERACHSITRIISNLYICLNNIKVTKVNRQNEKTRI